MPRAADRFVETHQQRPLGEFPEHRGAGFSLPRRFLLTTGVPTVLMGFGLPGESLLKELRTFPRVPGVRRAPEHRGAGFSLPRRFLLTTGVPTVMMGFGLPDEKIRLEQCGRQPG